MRKIQIEDSIPLGPWNLSWIEAWHQESGIFLNDERKTCIDKYEASKVYGVFRSVLQVVRLKLQVFTGGMVRGKVTEVSIFWMFLIIKLKISPFLSVDTVRLTITWYISAKYHFAEISLLAGSIIMDNGLKYR